MVIAAHTLYSPQRCSHGQQLQAEVWSGRQPARTKHNQLNVVTARRTQSVTLLAFRLANTMHRGSANTERTAEDWTCCGVQT